MGVDHDEEGKFTAMPRAQHPDGEIELSDWWPVAQPFQEAIPTDGGQHLGVPDRCPGGEARFATAMPAREHSSSPSDIRDDPTGLAQENVEAASPLVPPMPNSRKGYKLTDHIRPGWSPGLDVQVAGRRLVRAAMGEQRVVITPRSSRDPVAVAQGQPGRG